LTRERATGSRTPAPRGTVHPALLEDDALLAECETTRTRRSGPGGQHRNKVESAIVLKHRNTGIGAEASERRSQHENLRVALFRLRVNLALEHRLDHCTSEPSVLWKTRCRNSRIAVSGEHDDFPRLLAEVLDAIEHFGPDLMESVQHFGVTRTQLVKFLKVEPRGLAAVNRRRKESDLPPLR
jgi:hypothetical protein